MSFIPAELIRKKRDGGILNDSEIAFLIQGLQNKQVADYQMSAFLMAAFLKGLNAGETVALTREMKNSGRSMDWRKLSSKLGDRPLADKHSSGGVGDKISLILAPLAAACGLRVPMMSGRGLGHTGGTVDKLESISGFTLKLSQDQMIRALENVGVCMMAQADDLCPADKTLYALRDVTATVESVALITASIVSKKWAEGIDSIVYDVKCGDGAFMNSRPDAKALAQSLVNVSKGAGLNAKALVTSMTSPLGSMVGNAMEVEECLWILKNQYPSPTHQRLAQPVRELSVRLTAEMLVLAGLASDLKQGLSQCENKMQGGQAYEVFEQMLRAQGAASDWAQTLARAPKIFELKSPMKGQLGQLKSRALGVAGLEIGAGRKRKEDTIDPAVGFEVLVGSGEAVERNQVLLKAHLQDERQWEQVRAQALSIFSFVDEAPQESLVLEEII